MTCRISCLFERDTVSPVVRVLVLLGKKKGVDGRDKCGLTNVKILPVIIR